MPQLFRSIRPLRPHQFRPEPVIAGGPTSLLPPLRHRFDPAKLQASAPAPPRNVPDSESGTLRGGAGAEAWSFAGSNRWRNGGSKDVGPPAMTGSGRN